MIDLPKLCPVAGQSPAGTTGGFFEVSRRVMHARPLATDVALAALLLVASTAWLVQSPFASLGAGLLQAALVGMIAFRRIRPSAVFCAAAALAFVQWLLGYPLIGDGALLVALYTVSVHEPRWRAALSALVLEGGAVMAAITWRPADTVPRSLLFLTATVVAALCAGLTVASGSKYLAWLDERARWLDVERDQQATIAVNAERTRIARELHDVVSHNLSVVITLADGAALVSRVDTVRGAEAMAEVSEVGRHALSDMRAMLGVLRSDDRPDEMAPQPAVTQLGPLVERVRATGLVVDLAMDGKPFPLGAAVELSLYRIVQEALTNTLRHAVARRVEVTVRYDAPTVGIHVVDDGTGSLSGGHTGHGIDGMRERAALHGGIVQAGPRPGGGWSVSTNLRADQSAPIEARSA